MLVYRDSARSTASGPEIDALAQLVRAMAVGSATYETRLEALLRAGGIECALADLAHPSAPAMAVITDALAAHLIGSASPDLALLQEMLARVVSPPRFVLKTPEGYAYCALSPEFYAPLAFGLPRRTAPALVLGIRSIGTSLGAIVAAALRPIRPLVQRCSVRPSGHPFDRVLELDAEQRGLVLQLQAAGADFVIVDEGPGMSGSSLLSVADALERCGVSLARIHLLCSQRPDPERLRAPHAAERWMRYSCHVAGGFRPSTECNDFSGGSWRHHLYDDERLWPPCWTERERLKWLTPDRRWLDKFEGLPPYGAAGLARAQALAHAGYGPRASPLAHGFVRYAYLAGRPAQLSDLSAERVDELARYLAFRSRAFAVGESDPEQVGAMVRCNVAELCGIELGAAFEVAIERPVIADARMQPHEWRIRGDELFKTDGHTHGDDHLLPGPTDTAWDLSGAMIEWHMTPAQADRFVSTYERLTGDSPRPRLPAYLGAYCALRAAEMHYAALSSNGSELARQRTAGAYYRRQLLDVLGELDGASEPPGSSLG